MGRKIALEDIGYVMTCGTNNDLYFSDHAEMMRFSPPCSNPDYRRYTNNEYSEMMEKYHDAISIFVDESSHRLETEFNVPT